MDLIDRQAAIDALWKALYEYEDKTEKQFLESDDLDVGDWIQHRIFIQNMNDIDRQTILNLPPAQPEQRWTPVSEKPPEETGTYMTTIDYGEYGLVTGQRYYHGGVIGWNDECVIAWQPLPEPYERRMT